MTGLVGWWPLNENSGTTARDLSGNGNHGSLNGGVTQGVAGKGGLTSYSFEGSDDRVTVSSSSEIRAENMGEYTVSVWVRPKLTSDGFIFGKSTSGNEEYSARLNSDGSWFVGMENENDDGFYVNAGNVTTNQWHHLVLCFDGHNIRVYIDNTQLGNEIEFSGTVPGSTKPLDIGAHNKDKIYFPGSISDLRVYNRALSPQEIQTLYEWGNGDYASPPNDRTDSSAVSRWAFDGDVSDFWGSNDGTDNTSAGFSSDAIRGQAKVFDGTGGVDTGISRLSTPFTVSGWIKSTTPNENEPLIGNDNASSNNDFSLRVQTDDFRIYNDNGDSIYAGLTAYPKEWYHLAAVATGNKVEIYVNGILQNSGVNNGSFTYSTSVNWSIGGDGRDRYVNGKIDDVRIYDRALSPSEVFQLYQWGTRGRDMRKLTTNQR